MKIKNFIDHNKYRIKIINIKESIEVKITHRKNGIVGHGWFAYSENGSIAIPGDIWINEGHRRIGIGSKMYSFVEVYLNIKIIPSERQSEDAALFWAQHNRAFGVTND